MALTDEERRRLDDLAGELSHDDPRLARVLSGGRRHIHLRMSVRALILPLLVVAIPLMVVGVSATEPLLFAIACIALISAGMISLNNLYQRRHR